MEKMSLIFFMIIAAYLVFSFIKTRFGKTEKRNEKNRCSEEKKEFFKTEEETDTENAAIAAVIAAIMGDAAYVIKRHYAIAAVDERKTSSWRHAGRNEMMTRKNTIK